MVVSQVAPHLAAGLTALAAAAAVAVAVAQAATGGTDPGLRAQLQAVAQRSVFFGHQSVGGNVLDGLRQLAGREGVSLEIAARAPGGGPGLSHALLGQNGDPLGKIDAFTRAVDGGGAVDVALMKLCYVDFHAGTDPAAVFARYREALAGLRLRHPGTTFVHVTAPLTTIQGGWKPLVKRLLGRETSHAENARRERYNALLRGAYAGKEPLFDLARLESTRPDGTAETASWKGQAVPALVAAFTDDGGHLNAAGQDRVARALVSFLAALPRAGSERAP